jgi:hypothetical protein
MSLIKVNMEKYRAIAHEKRREARSAEFAPLDIKATIPPEAEAAEAARQLVREKYAALQAQMDAAQSAEELKALLP